jgi:hypothetical protein
MKNEFAPALQTIELLAAGEDFFLGTADYAKDADGK